MIHLRTLGPPHLEEFDGSVRRPLAAQSKRLALLAYLALAGPGRFRRRDSVIALFWPESNDAHARGALRQSLSYLRRAVGRDAVVTRGEEEISVEPTLLRCDAVVFEQAVAAGRYEEAMTAYCGEFLEGLFVSDASVNLERWVDEERARLRNGAAQACWSLADASRRRSDWTASATWGRQASSLSPHDEGKLRRLMQLLDSMGDKAGAVEVYDRFARQLADDYATEPSAETQATIEAIRGRVEIVVDATALAGVDATPPAVALVAVSEQPIAADTGQVAPLVANREHRVRHGFGPAKILVVSVVLAVVGYLGSKARARAQAVADGALVLAVMPIQNMSGDTLAAVLGDGLTEQLITELAQVPGLSVINHRTMMTYRASRASPRLIAHTLGVDAVLTGTLLRLPGDSLRLSVEVVRAGEDRVIWARSYSAARSDLLRVTRQVARGMADYMRPGTASGRRAAFSLPRPVDPIAVDLYMQGRYYWNKRGAGLLRSIQLFTAALDADPTFALPYAGMADAYVQLGYSSTLRPDDAFPKARAAALRALELDSTLAEPHATLGFVSLYFDWNWPVAEREFRRALTMNPSYATGHEWYGLFLAAMGRFDEAIAHERQAQTLDPLSTAISGTAAWVLYYAGRNDDAARELKVALRADSSFALGHFYLGRVEEARGAFERALAEYGATGPLRDWVPTVAAVGYVQGTLGRHRDALATLARLESRSHEEYVTSYAIALVHASLGQTDSAFVWLARGEREHTHWMVWLRRDPRWAPIRADPRFEDLARRLRLPASDVVGSRVR